MDAERMARIIDLDGWADDDLQRSIDGAQRELSMLGVRMLQIDPSVGPLVDALHQVLIEAGVIEPARVEHLKRVHYLAELQRGVEELRATRLATHKPGPLLVPRS